MNTRRYVMIGALVLSMTAPVCAQDVNFETPLKSIVNVLKDKPEDVEATKDLIKTYKKEYKKDPKALIALGNALVSVKRYAEAEEIANIVIQKNKNFGDAYILLGNIAALKDDGGNAAMWFEQAMTMDPKNPQGYMSYAAVNRKFPEEAERALNKLKQERPDFPIEAEAAHTYYSGGRYDKALENFDKADKNKLKEFQLNEYAVSAYLQNKKEQSLELAKFGINKFPKSAAFQRVALWSADDLQKFEEAIKFANVIVNTDSIEKTQRDIVYYGMALAGNKQYNEAITQYNKALEMKSDDIKPLQYISDVYTAMGDEDKALEYNEKYMSANTAAAPSDYAKLAGVYLAKAEKLTGAAKDATYDKAFSIYNKIAEKFPSIAGWAGLQAGFQASKAGYDEKAASFFQNVIDLLENKEGRDNDETGYLKSAYSNIGYYYWGTKNDLEKAKPYYEKLYKLDPNDKNAKAALGITDESAQ